MAGLSILDSDSDLSDVPSSPPSSPSPSTRTFRRMSEAPHHRPLTPPPSTHASPDRSPAATPETTPRKRALPSTKTDSPPAKRRRVADAMPRETKHLDLDVLSTNLDSPHTYELERLVKALRTKRKIVVVAGAGISVSAGIPDFRSSTGLFNSLKRQHSLKASGKQLFDAAVYRDDTSTTSFHEMVRSLSDMTKSAKPTPFHHLIARLAQEDRLLRLYSQNVDGIDTSLRPLATEVPLPSKGPWPKTIQLHGGLAKMSCTKCNQLFDFESALFEGPTPPDCANCIDLDHVRTSVAGKRSHGVGRLRPRMVLYNEHNPDDEAIGAVTRADLRTRPDVILVVGTSLKIPGVRRIVREMCGIVRDRRDGLAVWINNDPVPSGKEFENCFDLVVKGTCDEIAVHASLRKWDDDIIGEWQEVTKEEVQQAQERSNPTVIVTTPTKPTRNMDCIGLPSPRDSPRPCIEVSKLSFATMLTQQPALVKDRPQLAASKGPKLAKVINDLQQKQPLKKSVSVAAKSAQREIGFKVTKKAATGSKKALDGIKPMQLKTCALPNRTTVQKDTSLTPISPSAVRNNTSQPHKLSGRKISFKAINTDADELSL